MFRMPSVVDGVDWDLARTVESVRGHDVVLFTAGTHEDATRRQASQLDHREPAHRSLEALSCMFAVLWPVARVAADLLVDEELAGCRFLEVGCGPGLPSLVAARRGADVLATDHHPDALALVQLNARANDVVVQTALLDWQRDRAGTFDRLLASDVLFAAACCVPLAALIADALAPDGVAWVVDPCRAWHDEFEQAARDAGLTVHTSLAEAGEEVALVTTVRRDG